MLSYIGGVACESSIFFSPKVSQSQARKYLEIKTVKQSQIKVFVEKYSLKNLHNSLIMNTFTS